MKFDAALHTIRTPDARVGTVCGIVSGLCGITGSGQKERPPALRLAAFCIFGRDVGYASATARV